MIDADRVRRSRRIFDFAARQTYNRASCGYRRGTLGPHLYGNGGTASFRRRRNRVIGPAAGAWSIFCYQTQRIHRSATPRGPTSLEPEAPQEDEGTDAIMNTKPVYLTAEGLEKPKAELNELITVDRPRIAG